MPYNNSQPLGSTARGGGGGWRLLSAMGKAQAAPATAAQEAAMKAGAGPLSHASAEDFIKSRPRPLGLGSSVYDRVNSDMGFQNSMAGYTAGTGSKSASGNSY